MYSYSRQQEPPAPFLDIRVSAAAESEPVNVRAILDTGSDATALPDDTLKELGVEPVDSKLIGGISGEKFLAAVFDVFIALEQDEPAKVEVYSWYDNYAILGRDILNKYVITLDGPNLTLTIDR